MNNDRRRMMMGISSSRIDAKDINSASPGDLIINDYSTTNFLALDCSQDSVDYVYSHLSTVCPVGFCISNDNNGNVKVRSLHLVNYSNPGVGLANTPTTQNQNNSCVQDLSDLNNGLSNSRNMLKELHSGYLNAWNGTGTISQYMEPQTCACLRYDPCVLSWLSNSTSVLKGYFYLPAINELLACKNINNSITSWKALTDVTWSGIPSIRTITNAWSSTTADNDTPHYSSYILLNSNQTTRYNYNDLGSTTLCAVMWIQNGSAKHVGGNVFLTILADQYSYYPPRLGWEANKEFTITICNYNTPLNLYLVNYNLNPYLTLYNRYNGYFYIKSTENSGTTMRHMISEFTYGGDSFNVYCYLDPKPHLTIDPLYTSMNSNGGILKVNVYNNGSNVWGDDVTITGAATRNSDGSGYINISVSANTNSSYQLKLVTFTYESVSSQILYIHLCSGGFNWVTPQSGGLGYYVFVPNGYYWDLTGDGTIIYPILYYNGTNLYLVRLPNSPGYYSCWDIDRNTLTYNYMSSSLRSSIISAYTASNSSITLYNKNVSNMSNDPTFDQPVSLKGQFQSC